MVELLGHEHNCFSQVGSKVVEGFDLQQFFGILFFLWRIFQRQGQFMGLLFLLNGRVSFGFFRKSLLFEGARCTSTGFWRHGLETSGEFVILLRYDISELQEMGGGVEMQAAEAAEWNWSVSLCRVKTWPQLMCCALV